MIEWLPEQSVVLGDAAETPAPQKSNTIWWVLGGLAVVGGVLWLGSRGAVFANPRSNPIEPAEMPKEWVLVDHRDPTRSVALELTWHRSEKYPDSGGVSVRLPLYRYAYPPDVERLIREELRKLKLVVMSLNRYESILGDHYNASFRDRAPRKVRHDLTPEELKQLEEHLLKILRDDYRYWREEMQRYQSGESHYRPREPEVTTGMITLNAYKNHFFEPLDRVSDARARTIVRSALERLRRAGLVERTTGYVKGREVKVWAPTT